MKFFNYKRVPYAEIRAFSVHILTASGSFLAFLGVVAAAEHRSVDMFWWLGLALAVDGIDGPIARKVRVKEVLPNWSGDTLDNVIDYVTYVLLPAFALYQSGMIGEPWSFFAAGAIVMSSAIYYADMGMKTDEYFFSGFPVVWNMVVFTLFVIDASEVAASIVVVGLGRFDVHADQLPAPGARQAVAAAQSGRLCHLVGAQRLCAAPSFRHACLGRGRRRRHRHLSLCHRFRLADISPAWTGLRRFHGTGHHGAYAWRTGRS